MSELKLDQIERRLGELSATEREAWLDHIVKRFNYTQPVTITPMYPQPYVVPSAPEYPAFPWSPTYPGTGTMPWWLNQTTYIT